MNLEKVKEAQKKHLATKKARESMAEERAKEHDDAVEAFCEKILQHLASDDAYDSEGIDGDSYKETAWCYIRYATYNGGYILPHSVYIELPCKKCAECFDFEGKEILFKRFLDDVFAKFEQLEEFEVIGHRIVMKLED